MSPLHFEFINDHYRKARGGYSQFLNIYCEKCKHIIALYQKDGPGTLRRMYIDRVRTPEITPNGSDFQCSICNKTIGTFFIYTKEDRPAIRLYQDSVTIKQPRWAILQNLNAYVIIFSKFFEKNRAFFGSKK